MSTQAEPRTMTASELWREFGTTYPSGTAAVHRNPQGGDWAVSRQEPVGVPWTRLGTGPSPKAAIAAALGVQVAEDPQALALEYVVAELERLRAQARDSQLHKSDEKPGGSCCWATRAMTLKDCLALLRRVDPD